MRSLHPRPARLGVAALLLAGAAALAGPVSPALAHNTVIGESPKADSTVSTQPGTVALETSDALLDVEGATAMDVVGPDGRHYATACPSVDRAIASVPAELGPEGEYTVAWRVVSADGHPITGEFEFTWAPSDGETLAEGAEEPVCEAAAASGDAVEGQGDGQADAAASGGLGDLAWVIGGAAVVALAALVAFLVMRRRPAPATGAGDESVAPGSAPPADSDDDGPAAGR